MKKCSKCEVEKDGSEFTALSRSPDGLYPSCRMCKNEDERLRKLYIRDHGHPRPRKIPPELSSDDLEQRRLRHNEGSRQRRRDDPEKSREIQKRYREKHPERYRAAIAARNIRNGDRMKDRRLRLSYGITLEDFRYRVAAQKGNCACCGKHHDDERKLHIDHDHTTGEIRGLICNMCNVGIGQLGDNVAGVLAALDYLRRAEVPVLHMVIGGDSGD